MPKYITEFNPDFENRPLSYSSLKAFQKSPQHFVEYRMTKKEATPAMAFGNVIDCLILTPDDFEGKYAIMEDVDGRTKAGREYKEKFIAENKGKTWIAQEQYDLAKFLAEKTFNNPKAKELLERIVRTQDKISWNDPETGLPMIGYKDATGDTFIMDLKTATDGSHEKFQSDAYKFGYHIQAGAYLEAEKVLFGNFPDFFHLVVETTAPYNISVFKADKDFIELGKQEYHSLLQQVKFCAENNLWHQGYEFHSATGYHQLSLPSWAKFKLKK